MYRQLEEIRDRKGEKIVLFFTLENVVGAGLGALVGLILLGTLTGTLLVGGLAAILLGGVGLLLTLDHGGLAGYARLLWWLRGRLRQATRGARWHPDDLAGARATTRRDRPLPVDGPVRVVRRGNEPLRSPWTTVLTPSTSKEGANGHTPVEQPAD